MKRKSLFLLVVFAVVSATTKAQMDSWMLHQWLNQMNANSYQQQQQMTNELMKIFEQENKRNDANAKATCVLLPGGEDIFFAHITAVYIGLDNLEITKRSIGDYDETELPSSSYFAVNGQIVTSSVFTPGTSIAVKRKDTGKILTRVNIPRKNDTEYNTFLQNAYTIAQMYNAQNNGSYPRASGTNNSSSTVRNKCSFCQGKGWIKGSSTPTYGATGTHWCSDCGETVNASHSHNKCPSCLGRGYIDKIK